MNSFRLTIVLALLASAVGLFCGHRDNLKSYNVSVNEYGVVKTWTNVTHCQTGENGIKFRDSKGIEVTINGPYILTNNP